MKATIIYGTNAGSTREAALVVQNVLVQHGVDVRVLSAADTQADDLRGADLVVFGSCTWDALSEDGRLEGQMQQHFLELRARLGGQKFSGQRFAVFGLGDRSYTEFCAAADKLVAFVQELGGVVIAQPLRIDGYFFRLDENQRLVEEWARSIAGEFASQAQKSGKT